MNSLVALTVRWKYVLSSDGDNASSLIVHSLALYQIRETGLHDAINADSIFFLCYVVCVCASVHASCDWTEWLIQIALLSHLSFLRGLSFSVSWWSCLTTVKLDQHFPFIEGLHLAMHWRIGWSPKINKIGLSFINQKCHFSRISSKSTSVNAVPFY